MGPFPFIRFDNSIANGGFYPLSNYQSDITNSVFGEAVDDQYVGERLVIALNEYRETIRNYNQSINGGNFTLISPSPFPAISGTQTLVFYIQDNQLVATHPNQFIEITIDLLDGVITSDTYVYAGTISNTGDYDIPLTLIEKETINTISIYQQNGAAIFSQYYKFDTTTETATSGLIRARDLTITDQKITRSPASSYPLEPNWWIGIQPFDAEQNYILSLFGRIVNLAFDSTKTISDLKTFASGLPYPTGFTYSDNDNTVDLVEITVTGSAQGFKLMGKFDTTWTFQRFYANKNYTGVDFIFVGAFLTEWPFEPNTGRYYQGVWFDIEQLYFVEQSQLIEEPEYCQPIKSGDEIQFNVIPELSNTITLESFKVGIFDCNGNFIQEIGQGVYPPVVIPDCIETFTTKIFFPWIENANKYWNWNFIGFVTGNGLAFLKMYFVDSNLNETFETQFSMNYGPGEDLDTSDLAGFCTQLEALIDGLGYTCVVTYVEGDEPPPQIEPQITIQITADLCNTVAINFKFVYYFPTNVDYNEFDVGLWTPIVLPDQPVIPTQFQASATIPFLPKGKYHLGLYNIDGNNFEIYSISNCLELDNLEQFTQMLEYGSAQDSIIEGFEYLNGWLQRIRVPLNGAGQTYSLEESIYRNSDGTFQKPQNSTDENISLHTDYLDLQTQRAMTSATRHPIFVLANQNLSVQGDLEIATNQDYTTNQSFRKLQQMRFQAKNQGYQPNNNSCLG